LAAWLGVTFSYNVMIGILVHIVTATARTTTMLIRWEYYATNFLGFVQLASITMLLKQF
jgi:hypothetical protein